MKKLLSYIFSFFSQKKVSVEIPPAKSVAVIFNLANHVSLLAATMYATTMKERTSLEVHLVDIRDIFPEVDRYVWVDCGTTDDFRDYYGQMAKNAYSDAWKIKALIDKMAASSIIISPMVRQHRTIEETTIGKVFFLLYEEDIVTLNDRSTFARYAISSEEWLLASMEASSAASYSAALQWCYHRYIGKPLTLKDFKLLLSEPSEEALEEYKQEQKEINRVISTRCRMASAGNLDFHYVVTTGPEVYGVIRRIAMAKKNYLHASEGSFGRVLYASMPIPSELIDQKRGLFTLAPRNEVVQ